jgi:hypothetical protein
MTATNAAISHHPESGPPNPSKIQNEKREIHGLIPAISRTNPKIKHSQAATTEPHSLSLVALLVILTATVFRRRKNE